MATTEWMLAKGAVATFFPRIKRKRLQQPLENWVFFEQSPFYAGSLEEPQFLPIQS
ncbi:hypothetical protein [Agathobaculum sp.]|uniref:hypothetical protein n=1 Tax=Agathobaculum sp. TaxID=2048138 RepID=UPI003D93C058